MKYLDKIAIVLLAVFLLNSCGGGGVPSSDSATYKKAFKKEIYLNQNRDSKVLYKDLNISNKNEIKIIEAPKNGKIKLQDSYLVYYPNSDFLGKDRLKIEANNSVKDIFFYVVDETLTFDNDYNIYRLNGSKISKKILLNTPKKELYVILTNATSKTVVTSTIYSNAREFKKEKLSNLALDVEDFNLNTYRQYLSKDGANKSYNRAREVSNSSLQSFFVDTKGKKSVDAKLVKSLKDINTSFGLKNLNIWVDIRSYGQDCIKFTCVDDEMVGKLANKFLKEGKNNDIYDLVTNILGQEWSNQANSKYSNLIKDNKTIDILLTDINDDNSLSQGRIGYFWAKDLFNRATVKGSNQRTMIYIDSVMFANQTKGDYWQNEAYSALAHEFAHMITFYQNSIMQDKDYDIWINELISLSIEDLLSNFLNSYSDRGVIGSDPTSGLEGNKKGRYSDFNRFNNISLTRWEQSLKNYANVSAFGAYLMRNYNGAKLLSNIYSNSYSSYEAITQAIYDTTGKRVSFKELLQDWAVAVVLSDITNLSKYQYNKDDFFTYSHKGYEYKLGSINFFNYEYKPSFKTAVDSINSYSNYYYKANDTKQKQIYLNLNLDSNIEAIIVAK